MKRDKIRIAIQKSGRLNEGSLQWLANIGIMPINSDFGRSLIIPCANSRYELLLVRAGDIPRLVQLGAADQGIVGLDTVLESGGNFRIINRLNFAHCRLVIAVPDTSLINQLIDLRGQRIATSYPGALRRALMEAGVNASIIELAGSVEASPSLGVADAICDMVETGNSLRQNKLREIVTISETSAVLIAR